MAVFDVILRLGSKMGPGGFASVQSGIQMVSSLSRAVTETIREMDKFKRVLAEVDMGMVGYADSAAAGQVATFEIMKALSNMNELGINPTNEQLKILAVRATDFAQKTGKDATATFKGTRVEKGFRNNHSAFLLHA